MARLVDEQLDFKFLAIGDSGVGKTSLLNRYVDGKFNHTLASTVGIDIRDKNLHYRSPKSNKLFNIYLQLWDTAGQERYRSLTTSFFRDAIGFFLVFDVTDETSFLHVRDWISEIRSNTDVDNITMILIGNKCDLTTERRITRLQALEFAQHQSVDYMETSALENINVAEAIELLLSSVMQQFEENDDKLKRNRRSSKRLLERIHHDYSEEKSNLSYCCQYS